MLYIFDIDGVLADVTHLLYLITGENKDFNAYYSRIGEALPIAQGCEVLRAITMCAWTQQTYPHGDIYFVTGRSELSRETTIKWLQKHRACGERPNLHMRSNKDFRPAHEVKHDLIQRISKETGVPFNEMIVFEDDPQCAKMYESLGCYVCHVRHDKAKS
jgi:hypothetical protein